MSSMLSAGTVVELSQNDHADLSGAASATYLDISCALTGLSSESSEREQIDVTPLCEEYAKRYIDGLKDADTASSDGFFHPSSEIGKALQAASESSAKRILRVTFKDGSKWVSLVKLQPFGFNASVGDAVKTTFNFKLDGKPELTTA